MDHPELDSRTGPIARAPIDDAAELPYAILELVADNTAADVTELPPLYDVVDPDALAALVATDGWTGTVTFDYYGYTVAVDGPGALALYEA